MTQTPTIPSGYTLYTHNIYASGDCGEPYQIAANLREAGAPIYLLDEDGGLVPTPFESASASCRLTALKNLIAGWQKEGR